MGPMGHIHPNTRPYFQKVDNPSIWYGPVVRNFWPKKSTKKSSFFGGHGDKKLHFFTKNGRNVTWMGSNGYIMHITYLNYVDISPAEPKKSIFRVCKTVKMTKIGKNDDFLVKIFFTENRILLIKIGFRHDPRKSNFTKKSIKMVPQNWDIMTTSRNNDAVFWWK